MTAVPRSVDLVDDGSSGVRLTLTSAWMDLETDDGAVQDRLAAAVYDAAMRVDDRAESRNEKPNFADGDPIERLEWDLSTFAALAELVVEARSSAPAEALQYASVVASKPTKPATLCTLSLWFTSAVEISGEALCAQLFEGAAAGSLEGVIAEDLVSTAGVVTLIKLPPSPSRLGARCVAYAWPRPGMMVAVQGIALGRDADVIAQVVENAAVTLVPLEDEE